MRAEGIEITDEHTQNLNGLEVEYEDMMDIMSNNGQDKLTDCLQVKIDEHKKKFVGDENGEECVTFGEEFHSITFGDVFNDFEGNKKPREAMLTDPDDFMSNQRLDYLLVLESNDETKSVTISNQGQEEDEIKLKKVGPTVTSGGSNKMKVDISSTRVEPQFTAVNPENGVPTLPFT